MNKDDILAEQEYLEHHGILGMKWGVRRYQNKDGSLTPEGRKRYDKVTDKKTVKQVFKEKGSDITDEDIKKAILTNPKSSDIKKYKHLFTASEIQQLAARESAIASLSNAENRSFTSKLATYRNIADTLSITVDAIKSTAYLLKTVKVGYNIVNDVKDEKYDNIFDELSILEGGGKKKNAK